MKNKISDLRNHMFAALERLSNEDLTDEQIRSEVERSKAISEIGKVIVESAKTEILHAKLTGRLLNNDNKFLDEDITNTKQIDRPPANYDNIGHEALLQKHAPKEDFNNH